MERHSEPSTADKSYMLSTAPGLNPEGRPYRFGGYTVFPTPMDEEDMDTLTNLTHLALAQHNLEMPDTHAPFWVTCKYTNNANVGYHRDTDYKSGTEKNDFPYIISFTLMGKALFCFNVREHKSRKKSYNHTRHSVHLPQRCKTRSTRDRGHAIQRHRTFCIAWRPRHLSKTVKNTRDKTNKIK